MDTDPNTRALIPGLAKSWQVEPNGNGLRFFLEENVPFNGGQGGVMTAEDVLWSREDIIVDDSSNSVRALMRRAQPEIVNDHEIVFRWDDPDADALDFIANQVGGMEISSNADAQTLDVGVLADRPIAGTGPYVFKLRLQNQKIVFQKPDTQHWRFNPDFDEIEFRWLSENSTRLAALLAGEIHITNIPYEMEPTALNLGMKIVSGTVNTMRTFMNFQGVYLNDPSDSSSGFLYPDSPLMSHNVRKALNKAIDRNALNEAFFFNLGETMHAVHVAPTHGAWNERWKTDFSEEYGYDPANARALLAEEGYGLFFNRLETSMFVLDVTQYSRGPEVIEAVAGLWGNIGVGVNLVTMDRAQRAASSRNLEFGNHITLNVLIAPPILAIRLAHYTGSPRGGGAEDFIVEEVFGAAHRSLDLNLQNQLIQVATDRIFDQHLSIPLFFLPVHAVVNPAFVDDWVFPGTVSGTWTHTENIKAK